MPAFPPLLADARDRDLPASSQLAGSALRSGGGGKTSWDASCDSPTIEVRQVIKNRKTHEFLLGHAEPDAFLLDGLPGELAQIEAQLPALTRSRGLTSLTRSRGLTSWGRRRAHVWSRVRGHTLPINGRRRQRSRASTPERSGKRRGRGREKGRVVQRHAGGFSIWPRYARPRGSSHQSAPPRCSHSLVRSTSAGARRPVIACCQQLDSSKRRFALKPVFRRVRELNSVFPRGSGRQLTANPGRQHTPRPVAKGRTRTCGSIGL